MPKLRLERESYACVAFKVVGGGGTGDFEVSRHVSKQIAVAKKLCTPEGGGAKISVCSFQKVSNGIHRYTQ